MPADELGRFYNELRALVRNGDKATLRERAKALGERFYQSAAINDVQTVRDDLNAEVRGPPRILPTHELENPNRRLAVAGGALEGLSP